MKTRPQSPPSIRNKRARFEYELLETAEAGIVLTGPEVKSLRAGKATLEESYAVIRGDELFLRGCNITPYDHAGNQSPEPVRDRKLLLHRREINKWRQKVTQRGLTLVPLSIYFNDRGLAKVSVALAKGKTHADKRESIKAREHKREMDRATRRRGGLG